MLELHSRAVLNACLGNCFSLVAGKGSWLMGYPKQGTEFSAPRTTPHSGQQTGPFSGVSLNQALGAFSTQIGFQLRCTKLTTRIQKGSFQPWKGRLLYAREIRNCNTAMSQCCRHAIATNSFPGGHVSTLPLTGYSPSQW